MSNRHWKRLAAEGPYRALGYYTFTVGSEKVGIQYLHCFRLSVEPRLKAPSALTFAMLRAMDDLTPADRHSIQVHSGNDHLLHYEAAFGRGEQCAIARWQGDELACECWVARQNDYFLAPATSSWIIQRCITASNHRGKGLYPLTLRFACDELQRDGAVGENIFIECNAFNSASARGIQKAGFTLAGKRLSVRSWQWRWPASDQECHQGSAGKGAA